MLLNAALVAVSKRCSVAAVVLSGKAGVCAAADVCAADVCAAGVCAAGVCAAGGCAAGFCAAGEHGELFAEAIFA